MTVRTPELAADLFRRPPDRWVETDGGAAALRTVGTGPDVLFVHGWPVSGATWRRVLPHLADHMTCHVVDLPGAGDSRFDDDTPLTIAHHVATLRRVVDDLATDSVAVVGHDSGGMFARHAMVDDPRLRALGLLNTEQPRGLSRAFRRLLMLRHVPALASILGWAVDVRTLRRHPLLFGDTVVDRDLLDGEFHEFFLRPLREVPARRHAAVRLLENFDARWVHDLADVHARLEVPVQLVWGARDAFFPVSWTREMVDTFPDARLEVLDDASLFVHEERPARVAAALLPILVAA